MTSKYLRSLGLLTALGAAFTACGDAGNGGIPGQPGPSGGPIATTGSGQTTGSGNGKNGGVPGQPVPGSGAGTTTGTGTSPGSGTSPGQPGGGSTCADACAKLASCGTTDSKCQSDCSGAPAGCIDCVANASCDGIQACASICGSTSGAGGSSSGTGGASAQGGSTHGTGGSSSATGGSSQGTGGSSTTVDCTAIAMHLQNDCMYPASVAMSFETSCASIPAACLPCYSMDCASIATCLQSCTKG